MDILPLNAKEQIAAGESLTVEFKSDVKGLPDRELVCAVVALANTEGGTVFLGIEDSGKITGLHPRHRLTSGIPALIANKTQPPLTVRVQVHDEAGMSFASISVPKSKHLVSTSEGALLRRRLKADGKPESVPFYPHEFLQRQSSMGLLDPSAQILANLTPDVFSPLERERMRDSIRRNGGDQSLLTLEDQAFDGALNLVVTSDGVLRPTLAGLLFLGREDLIPLSIPSHEVAFQVLENTEVRVNEFFRGPLLKAFEEVERLFVARLSEREFQSGLFRVSVPNFDRSAFREAFVNALVHRDYSRLGAVHVRIADDGLTISNPGGFVEGVNLSNLLVTEPRPRNPLLADIAKRIGLSERTGRGIDRIYERVLRYGRPAPDYSRSETTSVVMRIVNSEGDLDFLEIVLKEESRLGGAMPLDSLLILSCLKHEGRLKTSDLAQSTQKSEQDTRVSLERLVGAGLIEAHGEGRARSYTLSATLYSKIGDKSAYVRQAGFDPIQREQMILSYINRHGSIKRREVAELCRISSDQAKRLLRKLVEEGKLQSRGEKKGAHYESVP